MNDTELDRLLSQSAPEIAHPMTCAHCRASRTMGAKASGRRSLALILTTGTVVLGGGGIAAAGGPLSIATYLGWDADNAVSRKASDGNQCELAFRALPETGLIGEPPTPADAPEVLAAQEFLRDLDLNSVVVAEGAANELADGFEDSGSSQYSPSYFDNQAFFVAVVDLVRDDLASQGMTFDGRVMVESANECASGVLQP